MIGESMNIVVGFVVGFVLGFGAHYAVCCTKSGQDACKKCFDFVQLKSKLKKIKKKKGKK
tara:strand:- start:231 stop:410 length:180 start_codon:yes stop_codon:yes gene_type:complete